VRWLAGRLAGCLDDMERTLAEWSDPRISASEWGETQKSNITSQHCRVSSRSWLFAAMPAMLTGCTYVVSRSASPAHSFTKAHKHRHSLLLSIRSTVRAHRSAPDADGTCLSV
jgi:hypothetical protein